MRLGHYLGAGPDTTEASALTAHQPRDQMSGITVVSRRDPRRCRADRAPGQRAHLTDNSEVLDVGTGSGYGCALLTARLGAEHVTRADADPYLTAAACERLDSVGLRPTVLTADATGTLPRTYDRIIATVAVRPVRASWLAGCGLAGGWSPPSRGRDSS